MRTFLRSLRVTYLSVDPRSLGLFRLGLGFVLLLDLARRYAEIEYWYTNSGLLPNHTMLWRPPATHVFSFFFMASSQAEATLGFAVCAVVYVLFTAGYRTGVMQVLALLCRVSVNSRIAILENGGDMVLNLLCIFSVALPLGRRFSLDAWLAKPEQRSTEPVVSLAMLGLILQFAAIYFFNAISKDGAAWMDGSAVHYALHLDKHATTLGVWMREQLPVPVLRALTWGTLSVEWTGFALIITPIFSKQARSVAVVLLPLLHSSFALGLNLGGFTPAMIAFYPLLLGPAHWAWLEQRSVPRAIAGWFERRLASLPPSAVEQLRYPPRPRWQTRALSVASELAVAVLIVSIACEALNDNTSVPQALRVPEPAWAKAVVEYPRLLQGWRMFAPNPPQDDMMIYVDATTSDGVHVDPYNLVASRQPAPAGRIVPDRMAQSQFFNMYTSRIAMQPYADYRQAFLEWLLAYPNRTGKPADCLTEFTAYYISDHSPKLGERVPATPFERIEFLRYVAPKNGPCQLRKRTPETPRTGVVASLTP